MVAGSPVAAASTTAEGELLRHLERNAVGWFGGEGALRVQLVRSRRRRNATLHHFEVRLAGRRHPVLVKVPWGRSQARGPRRGSRRALPDALRMLPILSPEERGDLEHEALAWLHAHFADRDERFGAIRVLDYLPGPRALVMEERPDRNLADLYARALGPRRAFGAPSLERVLRNAGAWLRVFHGLPPPAAPRDRVTRREDFLASLERMCDFLLEDASDGPWLERVRAAVRERALAALPEQLPLAMAHGDFVPRNVLVGADDRVTVFDTRAQWRAPPYEDLARFRIALSSGALPLAAPGVALDRSLPDRCGAQLLAGYFGNEEPPHEALRLFEVQRLLSIRVAATHQVRIARGARRLAKTIALGLRARSAGRALCERLPEVEAP